MRTVHVLVFTPADLYAAVLTILLLGMVVGVLLHRVWVCLLPEPDDVAGVDDGPTQELPPPAPRRTGVRSGRYLRGRCQPAFTRGRAAVGSERTVPLPRREAS